MDVARKLLRFVRLLDGNESAEELWVLVAFTTSAGEYSLVLRSEHEA